jgi:putative ATPase
MGHGRSLCSRRPVQAGDSRWPNRLRPKSLDEVIGQTHLLGPDGTLRRMIASGGSAR